METLGREGGREGRKEGRKEAVVTYFMVLARHSPGTTE